MQIVEGIIRNQSVKSKTGASQILDLQVKQAYVGLFSAFWLYNTPFRVLQ
jgi:hypothetical protein